MSASPKHMLTTDERDAIEALRGVGMPCGCWDKRFRRDVLWPALDAGTLGDKAAPQLWRILIRYRRQLNHPRRADLLRIAATLAAPDFRKQQAALRAQAEIEREKQRYQEAMAR